MYSQRAAIAVANTRRAIDHFHRFPWRREPLERTRLGVPAKQYVRRRFNSCLPHETLTHRNKKFSACSFTSALHSFYPAMTTSRAIPHTIPKLDSREAWWRQFSRGHSFTRIHQKKNSKKRN